MKTHFCLLGLLAATTALSACSDGPSVVSRAGNTAATQVLTEDAGNAAQALADGETLRASQRTSSGWTRNFDEETAAPTADTTATLTRNDVGGVNLTIGDRTIVFTAEDLTEDGFGFENDEAGIFTFSADSILEALDPANGQNGLAFDYFADNDDGTGVNGFIVTGTETSASALANLPTATYDGWMRLRVAPTEGFDDFGAVVRDVRGDVRLTANFGSGTVSGTVDDLALRQPRLTDPTRTFTPFDGSLTMAETDITGNGFTGALTGDAGFNATVGALDEGSTYSGTFFGTDADEVGGAFNVTGSNGAPYVGIGVWQAYND